MIGALYFLARPESPTILSVETRVTDALVTWRFGDDGALELNALKVQYKKDSQSKWQEIQIKPPNLSPPQRLRGFHGGFIGVGRIH